MLSEAFGYLFNKLSVLFVDLFSWTPELLRNEADDMKTKN